jgi:hypothetical protein
METTMTAAIVDAKDMSPDRIKTCVRASTPTKAGPGECRRMIRDRGAPGAAGPEDPGGHGSNLGVRNDAAPTSLNSLVTGKGGDDGCTLIWSRRSANLIRQDRGLAFASGPELALWSRCGFLQLPQVRTIPLFVENATLSVT